MSRDDCFESSDGTTVAYALRGAGRSSLRAVFSDAETAVTRKKAGFFAMHTTRGDTSLDDISLRLTVPLHVPNIRCVMLRDVCAKSKVRLLDASFLATNMGGYESVCGGL